MVIQNNIMALNSFRQLGGNNAALAKNLEKLSSGFRINRAGDDAAGLAISEKMRAQITGLDTAVQNARDGISLIQTAEGALTEVHAMLNRMVELATQSSNGIYDDQIDRRALDDEFQALKAEIDRISLATNFNGQRLLDGSLSAGGLLGNQVAGGRVINYEPITITGTGTANLSNVNFADAAQNTVINIDGQEITIEWERHTSATDMNILRTDLNSASASEVVDWAAALERTINASIAASGTTTARVSVGVDNDGNITLTSGTRNGDSEITVVTGGAIAGVFANDTSALAADQTVSFNVGTAETFTMSIGGQQVLVSLASAITAGTTTMSQAAAALQVALQAGVAASTGHNGIQFDPSRITVEVGRDGNFVINNDLGASISFSDLLGGNTAATLGLTTATGMSTGGGLNLQIGDTGDHFNIISVSVDNMGTQGLGIGGLDIRTYEAAVAAVGTQAQQGDPGTIRGAINIVSSQRAALGALQNRLEHTINNLGVTTENLTAAESRIRDTDMAKEMMGYTKNNILIQAAQAMLAQANMVPQGVLQLLR